MKQRIQQVEWGAGERAAARLVDMCGDMVDVVGGRMPAYPRHSALGRLMGRLADEVDRLDKVVVGDGLTYESGPGGRILTYEPADVDVPETEQLYDVVSLGGWSMTVPGAAIPGFAGVEIVEDFYGEDFPVVAAGLTREEIEDGEWCWGRGNSETHFSLAIVDHGNDRSTWKRLPIEDPAWWHGDEQVPREEIYGRSIGENGVGGPICLQLRFGVFEG